MPEAEKAILQTPGSIFDLYDLLQSPLQHSAVLALGCTKTSNHIKEAEARSMGRSLHSHIRPDTFLFLRLPSDSLKLVELKPNSIVDVGKLGSFPSNLLLGRPYHYTYEILEKREDEAYSRLRIVTPAELNADVVAEEASPAESRGEQVNGAPEGFDLVADDGTVVMKNNRLTIDDASRQALSQQEIEELKKSSEGKEIIEKILANHSGLSEKTTFSKAKYTLRKTKKYLRRFEVLPVDIGNVIEYVLEKEAPRILEMREETLGLMMAWSNAHFSKVQRQDNAKDDSRGGPGRWLAVDETGGLVVAALAERMGLLYADSDDLAVKPGETTSNGNADCSNGDVAMQEPHADASGDADAQQDSEPTPITPAPQRDFPLPEPANTITLLHPAVQPNLSLLKYFGYDTNQPTQSHPLHTHLNSLSWLQLLHPEEDPMYREPEIIPPNVLHTWKSGKRSTYWKKRRRWERCKAIVDDTRAGGFEGLVVASNMDLASILPHTIPLVRGGGHIVLYSPTVEPLVKIMDLYSKDRRTAYIQHLAKGETPDADDFPVDPRLLLAPTLQTSRVRDWQVLPGRTHPLMTSPGGPEGYVFTARRVIPLEGGVEARGNFTGKKRKVEQAAA